MIKNKELQKSKTQERINKVIDGYYEAFEKGSNDPGFKINEIEKLMIENQKELRKVMNETSAELTSNTEIDSKKNALCAKESSNVQKKTKQ